jgi:peptidoglycan/LPS O-acetylase OafA/YrhL
MHYGYSSFYFTLARLDALAIGAALAIFARMQPYGLAPLVKHAKRLLFLFVPALGAIQLLMSGSHAAGIQIFRNTLIALVYGCLIVLAIENQYGRIAGTVLSGRILGSIGKYSYGMYVFHPFILSLIFRTGLVGGAVGLAAATLATYLAAWTSWNLFERRFLRLKRYFEYEQDPPAARLARVAAVK